MIAEKDKNNFPRLLTKQEKQVLREVLPDNIPAYDYYYKKLSYYYILSNGRFGKTNFILGKKDSVPDLTSSSTAVFAFGIITLENCNVTVAVHEEVNDQIEIDLNPSPEINLPENIIIKSKVSYSEWSPGDSSPFDNSPVRQITILPAKFILAISKSDKKIWLHNLESKVNTLIPVTNFYNQIMLEQKVREEKKVTDSSLLFENLESFSDNTIRNSFIAYNHYFHKFNIDLKESSKQNSASKKKNFFKKLFKGN